jgi:hypothetical protein
VAVVEVVTSKEAVLAVLVVEELEHLMEQALLLEL